MAWPAIVGRDYMAQIWGTFLRQNWDLSALRKMALPNRTFAAEESLPTAYKLIELCSLFDDVMLLPRSER